MEEWKPLYQVDKLKKLIDEAVAEAEHIPDMKEAQQEPTETTPGKEHQKQKIINNKIEEVKESSRKADGSMPTQEEIEKMANKAMDILETKDILDKPDEELTAEELQERQKEREKLLRKEKKKRYRKNKAKKKWYKAKINTNIYISNLPKDITAEEIEEHFAKCGAIRIDPNTGERKIKVYHDDEGVPKGDALLSFENIESVATAIEMLHESNIRPDAIISVEEAHFEQKGDEYRERKRQKVDEVEK